MIKKINVPTTIAAFVQAENQRDSSAVAACFTSNAVIHDEGSEMRGTTAIKEWIDNTFKKYQFTIEPAGIAKGDNKIILNATLTGDFPGSPISLDFQFTIQEDKIATLIIR
jgi:ketosteroid isomerase-like protein